MAKFRLLTHDLVALYQRIEKAADMEQGRLIRTDSFKSLQRELFDRVVTELMTDDEPYEIVSYVLYLVESVSNQVKLHVGLGRQLNIMGAAVNDMAAELGMVSVSAPGEAQLEETGEGETYTTGTGQKLMNIHLRQDCRGWCVIHNPLPGPWGSWRTHWRGDDPFDIWRGFERICPCGVGHPAAEEQIRKEAPVLHGCCGTCPCHFRHHSISSEECPDA